MKPALSLPEVAVLMRFEGRDAYRRALRHIRAAEKRSGVVILSARAGEGNGKRYDVDSDALRIAMPHLFVGRASEVQERESRDEVVTRLDGFEERLAELHERDEALIAEIRELRAALERSVSRARES